MPTLNKPTKKRTYGKYKKEIGKFYNKYRNIRDIYLKEHPLCEDCLNPNIINEDGRICSIVTPVNEVHHIKPILSGKDDDEKLDIATDYSNLVGLCEFHHHLRHNKGRL